MWLEDTRANPSPFLSSPNTNDATNALAPDLTFDPFSTDNSIDPAIFNSERWSDGPVEYTITGLDDGDTYDVTLFFMEHCCSAGCIDAEPDVDACDSIGVDGGPPAIDAQLMSSTCRVFDILINDELVQDQFSKNALAACLADVAPGADAYGIGASLTFEGVSSVGGTLKITLQDLGVGNPPENASIKGLCLRLAGAPPRERNCDDDNDNDGDGLVDCDDPDCADVAPCNEGARFTRGDTDGNGNILLNDSILIFTWLFQGGDEPGCVAAADASAQGQVNLTSGIYGLNFLFTGGAAPPAPFPECRASSLASDLSLGCIEEHCQ